MRRPRVFAILFSLLALVSTSALSDAWNVDDIAKNSTNNTQLMREDGKLVKVIPTARSQLYVRARDSIYRETNIYPKLFFSDRPGINAFAANDNGQRVMVVTLQMVDALGDDGAAVAALIGHEMAHHFLEHGKARATRNIFLELLAAFAGAYLDSKIQARSGVNNGFGSDITNLGGNMVSKAFTRDDEREADEYGLRWMAKAGYDPAGAIRLYETLMRHAGNSSSLFDTHPSSGERIENMQRLIAQMAPSKPVVAAYPPPIQVAQNEISTKGSFAPVGKNEKITGQVGIVLTLKPRYSYVILSGISPRELPIGYVVKIRGASGQTSSARIARSVEGYYSAIVDNDFSGIAAGDAVYAE